MMNTMNCPVCDRPNVKGDVCPNCDTDLSLIRKLQSLPPVPSRIPVGIATGAIALLFIFGVAFGVVGHATYASQPQPMPIAEISDTVSDFDIEFEIPNESCGGFYYRVRPGDSLALIALRFYGNAKWRSPLVQANPKLRDRPNLLKPREIVFVPNLVEVCPQ